MQKLISKLFLLGFFLCALNTAFATKNSATISYAIISPMPIEAQYIRSQIKDPVFKTIDGINYMTGNINNRSVISVISGYGKVNVIAVASRLLATFHPNVVILAETSGAINEHLKIGDVVIANKVFDAGFGQLTQNGPSLPILINNPTNHKKEPMIYQPDQTLYNQAIDAIKNDHFQFNVVTGTIADSDLLPNPSWQIKLLQENNVQAVAMDGAPVAKLCWMFDTKWLVLHSIANVSGVKISESGTVNASNNLGQVVVALVSHIPSSKTD